LASARFHIGYNCATHLIDLMERDGLVDPAEAPNPAKS